MAGIASINLEQPGAAEAIVTSVKQQMGSVPNFFATMAQSPAVLEGFLAFSGALGRGVLNAGPREQIALTVAGTNIGDYCASARTLFAKGAGVRQEEAALNLSGQASDERTLAILSFVGSAVQRRACFENTQIEALRNHGITDAELVAHIGVNMFANYFNHVAETEIDFPFVAANPSE